MDTSGRNAWVRSALVFGLAYFAIGRGSTLPDSHVQWWRLAAWAASAVVYTAHIAYEHIRLRDAPRALASHVALAVAIGALALAIAGMVHAQSNGSGIRPAWFLALLVWPAVTAIPAFLGALIAASLLTRLWRGGDQA